MVMATAEGRRTAELFRDDLFDLDMEIEDVADIAQEYAAEYGVDILSDVLEGARYVLKEISEGRKPYTVSPGLLRDEGKLGKYDKGRSYLDEWVDRDEAARAHTAVHEKVHERLAPYDTPGNEHPEEYAHRLTRFSLSVHSKDRNPKIAQYAEKGYNFVPFDQIGDYISGRERYLNGQPASGSSPPGANAIKKFGGMFSGMAKGPEKFARRFVNNTSSSWTTLGDDVLDRTPESMKSVEEFGSAVVDYVAGKMKDRKSKAEERRKVQERADELARRERARLMRPALTAAVADAFTEYQTRIAGHPSPDRKRRAQAVYHEKVRRAYRGFVQEA